MKKRNVFKVIYELIKFVGPFIYVILFATLLGTLGFILAMNITIFGALAIVKFMGVEVYCSYLTIFLIIGISGIFRGVIRYGEQYFNHFMAFKLLALIRNKLFHKLRELSPSKLDAKNKGEIISLLQSDIETLEVFYAHTISPLLIAVLTSTTVFLFIGFMTSWYLALIALLSYIILGVIVPTIYYLVSNKYGKKYRSELGKFEEFYLDSIYGYYEILSSNNENNRIKEMNKKSKSLIELNTKLENKGAFFKNVTTTVILLMNLLIIGVGGVLIKENLIASPNIILAFVALTSSFGSVLALSQLPGNLAMTFASGNRVIDLLEEKPQVIDSANPLTFEFNKLEVKNITFKYDDEVILKHLSLEVNKNEIVGILGPSGSGKSTLLKLLMRFYDPSEGEILYNERNIKDIKIENIYNNVNLFSQTTYLFRGTILENLLIANPSASKDEVIEATKNASIYQYILNLPKGFDTKISDLKDNFSSGEKQRLGLARVFLRKPKLLLLDEATSNIDAINEGIVLNALKKYKGEMSIVIISHRPSTLSICDRVYKINEAR